MKSFRITGATRFPESKLLPLVKEYAGREVSLADLEQAAARISKFYRQNGFPVARAYVPAQEIKDGGVEIAVLEGRYGKLDLRNSSRLSDSLARDTLSAAPTAPSSSSRRSIANCCCSRISPGVASAATLTPGEQVGTSDLVVDITPTRTFTGTLEADNYGNRYTGSVRLGRQCGRGEPRGTRRSAVRPRALTEEAASGTAAPRIRYRCRAADSGWAARFPTPTTRSASSSRRSTRTATRTSTPSSASYPAIRSTRGNLDAQTAFNYFTLDDVVDSTDRQSTLAALGRAEPDWRRARRLFRRRRQRGSSLS